MRTYVLSLTLIILCCSIKTAAAVFVGNATEMPPSLRPPEYQNTWKCNTFKYNLRVVLFWSKAQKTIPSDSKLFL